VLKKEAYPTIFPNVPSYLSVSLPPSRPTTSATTSERWDRENERLLEAETAFFEADNINSLHDIKEKVFTDENFTRLNLARDERPNCLILSKLKFIEDFSEEIPSAPKVEYSLVIKSNMEYF